MVSRIMHSQTQPATSASVKRAAGAALLFLAAMGMLASDTISLGGGNARRLQVENKDPNVGGVVKAGTKWAQQHPANRDDCPTADLDLILPMHHKDFPLASTLFNSLERALPCFHELIIIVPPESEFALLGGVPAYAKVFVVPDPLPAQYGYLSQQVVKLYADTFSTAPRVLILEADLIMKEWHDECFFSVDEDGKTNGKVRAYCIDEKNGAGDIWFKGTTHAIGGETVTMDCCVNSPFAFPREVFPAFRKHVSETHKKPFGEFMEDYFAGHSKGWENTDDLFSEFNILSHFMIRHRPDLVELVTPNEPKKFGQRTQCSDHYIPSRNYELPNPKLSTEYFDSYYHMLDEQKKGDDGRIRRSLDLTTDVKEEPLEGARGKQPTKVVEGDRELSAKQPVPLPLMRGTKGALYRLDGEKKQEETSPQFSSSRK